MATRLLCVAFTIVCLVDTSADALAQGSKTKTGRGEGPTAGKREGASGTRGGRQNGETRDTGIRTAKAPRPPRQRSPGPQSMVGIALPVPADSIEPDAESPDAAPPPSAFTPPAEPSSIHPLPPPALTRPTRASPRGGLRIDLEPETAHVYMDGFFMGTARDFNRSPQGLPLAAGWHRLEFRAPGYETPAVNVTIEANRTTSYRGALRPTRP
jgi:hypothetical protein